MGVATRESCAPLNRSEEVGWKSRAPNKGGGGVKVVLRGKS